MLSDQSDELEHDLLSGQQACSLPCREGLLGRSHCRLELFIGGLRDAGDEVVGSGVVEIDPLRGLRSYELVVEEVLRVDGLLDLFVRGGVFCCRRLEGGCSSRLQLSARHMELPAS